MTNRKTEIGRRIRHFRTANNLTQAQLAESLDISTNFISEVETGKKNISLEILCRLCQQYHLSTDYILLGTDSSSSPQHTLSEFLFSLSADDIPTIIEYLEASMKLKKLEEEKHFKKYNADLSREQTPELLCKNAQHKI